MGYQSGDFTLTRLAAMLVAGATLLGSGREAIAQGTALHITSGAHCTEYTGTDSALRAKVAAGQFVYVLWGEESGNGSGSTDLNYGETQMMPLLKNGKPNPNKAVRVLTTYETGWYIFQAPATANYVLLYYNRGYTPDRFKVAVCFLDELVDEGRLRQFM